MYLDFKENPVGPIQSVVSGGGAASLPASPSPPATPIRPPLGSVSHLFPQACSWSLTIASRNFKKKKDLYIYIKQKNL